MRMLIAGTLSLLMVATAQAQTTKGSYAACLTEAKLDEATRAINKRDQRWFESIGGCVITKAGLNVRVIERGWLTSKVRIFTPDGNSLIMYTPSENIRD